MSSGCECKVGATAERYDLDGAETRYESLDDHLLARWTGEDGRKAAGYRTLTEWFNKRLLKRAYDDRGRETIGTRLDAEYDALTGDDDLLRGEVADDLAADGIDADQLRDDMVSWSTMRHHLSGCLDGEKATPTATTDWERGSIEIARDRTREKAESALRALGSKERLAGADDAEVDVQVLLSCPECQVRVPFDVALDRGYVCEEHSDSVSVAE